MSAPQAPTTAAPPDDQEDRVSTLRDEDISTTTNTLPGPGGDADGGDSDQSQVDPAGVDPSGSDTADADGSDAGGGDADSSDS